MSDFLEWDRRTAALLEDAYVTAGAGPGGSGSGDLSEGAWRAKRQHLAVPMDEDGTWLDVGCTNGHLLATLPGWAAERGVTIEPHGLELLPAVAALARSLHPQLASSIWTGSVMSWTPPRRFRYVTTLDDAVPPDRLDALVTRLLSDVVASGGRLIVSSYTNAGQPPRSLFEELGDAGHPPDGIIHVVCLPSTVASAPGVGRAYRSGPTAVIVLRSVLHQADPDLVRFVVAHEAAHVAQNDTFQAALMNSCVAGVFSTVLVTATADAWLLLVAAAIVGVVAALWRRELACDRFAVQATGPLSAARFIAYLGRVDRLMRDRPRRGFWATVRPRLTHPPTSMRRRHLATARTDPPLPPPDLPTGDLLGTLS